ncbi:MAG: ABC transporter ATP-binding protein [Anaeroplasma sp.]
MIYIKDICKTYGENDNKVEALKNVNATIQDGKFTAIIGKSGSGKTTLMNLIGGLDRPSSGQIIFDNIDISQFNDKELASYRNKTIGYVFQSFYLEPNFSVLENVCLPLTIAGMERKEREKKAKDLLITLGLEDKITKKAKELSGGQKQRVSIARALITNPKVILADEPTGNLDSENGQEVMKLLRNIANNGNTVILVTHNMDDAKKADILIKLKDGHVLEQIENNEESL